MGKLRLVFWLTILTIRACALDCGRATGPIERAICKEPELVRLDAELNDVYGRLRPKLTAQARATVTTQQRAWVAERDRVCANGDAACLRNEYTARLDKLLVLDAAASSTDRPWRDLHPLVVTGSWKATTIHDPGGRNPAGVTDVPQSLSDAALPNLGEVVHAMPGKICMQGAHCQEMAWTRTTLAKVEEGAAVARIFGLNLSTQVLSGNPGGKMIPPLLLILREDGKVWADFALCGQNASNCHDAIEEWTPVGPSYSVSHLP